MEPEIVFHMRSEVAGTDAAAWALGLDRLPDPQRYW
jgi:hypothetical protein